MSVRRLADDAVQPSTFAFSGENEGWAEQTIQKYPAGRQQSAVIPLLMRAQEQDGWVTRAAVEHVAERLEMPLIRVLEVATFYTQFQLKPVGTKAHIQVCGTTPCMLRGSDELKAVCAKRIHPEPFHLNHDGTLSWEEVECLGACVNAPMVMVFKDTYEDLTPARLEEIIDAFEGGEAVAPGPQVERHLSAPIGGATTLTTFDDSESVGDAQPDGPASGAARQTGAGAHVDGAPSQAARVDTHAEETDPSVKSPGAAAGAATDQARETAESADPDAGAVPGTGTTGGTAQGPTGASTKEDGEEDRAVERDAGGSEPGELAEKEASAEDVVVTPKRRPKADPDGSVPARKRATAAEREKADPEAKRRTTSDTEAAAPKKATSKRAKSEEPTGSKDD